MLGVIIGELVMSYKNYFRINYSDESNTIVFCIKVYRITFFPQLVFINQLLLFIWNCLFFFKNCTRGTVVLTKVFETDSVSIISKVKADVC